MAIQRINADCDEDILQITTNEDDIFDVIIDKDYVNCEKLFLKFFQRAGSVIEKNIIGIVSLLDDRKVKVKGMCFKGSTSVLIEVLLTSSFRTWMIELIEARNNIRALSDRAREDFLKMTFGKFQFIVNGEIVFLNVIPNVSEHFIDCKSSYYPYGLSNGNLINIEAKNIREEPIAVISNFVSNRSSNQSLHKINGFFCNSHPALISLCVL